MENNNQKQSREAEQIYKLFLSSDCSLELDYMKVESLVMANQQVAVNMSLFLALTARQTMGAEVFWRFACRVKEKIGDWS